MRAVSVDRQIDPATLGERPELVDNILGDLGD
jgi:hypothetical protein